MTTIYKCADIATRTNDLDVLTRVLSFVDEVCAALSPEPSSYKEVGNTRLRAQLIALHSPEQLRRDKVDLEAMEARITTDTADGLLANPISMSIDRMRRFPTMLTRDREIRKIPAKYHEIKGLIKEVKALIERTKI